MKAEYIFPLGSQAKCVSDEQKWHDLRSDYKTLLPMDGSHNIRLDCIPKLCSLLQVLYNGRHPSAS